ncbi:hypothetical protein F4678DRAFT_448044 [Xylaria arbuscula]|nr:hypothetical protein F4678DRAFT_448044 [Xylaria arbuscula]
MNQPMDQPIKQPIVMLLTLTLSCELRINCSLGISIYLINNMLLSYFLFSVFCFRMGFLVFYLSRLIFSSLGN